MKKKTVFKFTRAKKLAQFVCCSSSMYVLDDN